MRKSGQFHLLGLMPALVGMTVGGLGATPAADFTQALAPLQQPDLAHAKQAVANLTQLATTQAAADRLKTQRLATVIKNLFTAEYQLTDALAAGRHREGQALRQERSSREWMTPNAFGRTNDSAAKVALEQAAELRATAAQRIAEAQHQLVAQLQETDSVMADFDQIQAREVVLVLAAASATVNERSLARGAFSSAFPRDRLASLRSSLTQPNQRDDAPKPPRASPAQLEAADLLDHDLTAWWPDTGTDALPPRLPAALAQRVQQIEPPARFPGPRLAGAIDQALGSQPLDLHALAGMCAAGRKLPPQAAPWLETFTSVLDKRRAQSLALQQQAVDLLRDGDIEAAKARLQQAGRAYPSPALAAYAAGLEVFQQLSRNPPPGTDPGDWRQPALAATELLDQAAAMVGRLRAVANPDILPALAGLTTGLDGAGMLSRFRRDCQPADARDTPHPIRALQALRQSPAYRALQADDSPFAKPLRRQVAALDASIGPQARQYDSLLAEARDLDQHGKHLAAAAKYRLANNLDFSPATQQAIATCEAQTSGL